MSKNANFFFISRSMTARAQTCMFILSASMVFMSGCGGEGGGSTSSTTPTTASTTTPTTTTTTTTSTPIGDTVTTFELSTPVAGLQPFTVGLGFKKGQVTATPTLNISDQQVIVQRRWNDGSVKHAIASGHVLLAANTRKTIAVQNSASALVATSLTKANIQSANPQASLQFGTLGTVELSTLLATPFRTFISGPEMVEAHYRAKVGADATLTAWFHVRLYKNGKVWIRAIAENGLLDVATADKSYTPTVTIGGVKVWNNGGTTFSHYAHTRWAQEGWIGGDPQLIPKHDTAYLKTTRLVPNYMVTAPSTATQNALNGLYQSYTPNQNGGWTPKMGGTGFQDQIGLLPLWDALYVTSGADARAYKSVLANAKALNSYPIVWNDSLTKIPVKPSDRPNWSLDGPDQGGNTNYGAGALNWEIAHHGSGGYVAYLLTGDYYYLETMEAQASTVYLMAGSTNWSTQPPSPNLGTSRNFQGQTRGYAWSLRTVSQYAGIAPAGDALAAEYQQLLANNMKSLKAIRDTISPSGIGYFYEYDANLYGPGMISPWQQHFFIQAVGMGSDVEPLSDIDMTTFNQVRDYLYRGVVGILGDASGYCFTQASVYNIKTSDGGPNAVPSNWYKTWAQVYSATFTPPPACQNTLDGGSGSDPSEASTGFWGNLIPAIAYAVDHGAPGAAASWARMTGASNWPVVLNSGFDSTPIWGVVPL